jgi:ABC-type lipoprotein release transport system permease subunit
VVLPVILVLVVPAALVLAVAVAAVPGESAARTRPAEILRSE